VKAGILLIIIALLALLYVVVVLVIGGSEEAGVPLPINMESVTFDSIRSRLTRSMTSEHISVVSGGTQNCQVRSDRLLVAAGTTCVFDLEPSEQWTRRLTLSLGQTAGSINLGLTQPNALSIEETLAAGQAAIELDIYTNDQGQKGRLTVSACQGVPAAGDEEETAAPCVLQIAD
jgi:hypothetical protein